MPSTLLHASAPGLHADDAEIEHYALLLDRLDIGLVVYRADASALLRNAQAAALLGDAVPAWADEHGQPLADNDQPPMQTLRTGRPVHDRVIGLGDGAPKFWLNTNALPVFAKDGSVRRVLLTLSDISGRRHLESEIERLSIHDPLTGAANRRHTLHVLDDEIHRARRYGTPFALAQIDIDGLRQINEAHGHQAGDRVLSGIAQLLRQTLREIDVVGRYGGDEFLLVLPNVRLNDAMIPLERVRAQIEAEHFGSTGLHVTISGGVTEYAGENSAAMIARAETLLSHARDAGCNRLCQDVDMF